MPYNYKEFYRRNLPHYQIDSGIYAITFRLAWTLPLATMMELKEYKDSYTQTLDRLNDFEKIDYKKEFGRAYFKKFDKMIDKANESPKWLSNKDVVELLSGIIQYNNGVKYKLIAYCIMPNHVHLILLPLLRKGGTPFSLSNILHSIKTFSSKKCNELLGREGQFWHHESYDHLIRDEKDFGYQLEYLLNNPVSAGLVTTGTQWEYCWVCEDVEL